VNTRAGQVRRAQRALRLVPDTRAIKRELQHGNPYALALLGRRGLVYTFGAIKRKEEA
jgi:hypothetical protein